MKAGAAALGEGRRHSASLWRRTTAAAASSGRGNGRGVTEEEEEESWQARFLEEFPNRQGFLRWSAAAEEELEGEKGNQRMAVANANESQRLEG